MLINLTTQWRHDPSGRPVGLDYGVLPVVMRFLEIARADWPELFQQIRVMEHAVLTSEQ